MDVLSSSLEINRALQGIGSWLLAVMNVFSLLGRASKGDPIAANAGILAFLAVKKRVVFGDLRRMLFAFPPLGRFESLVLLLITIQLVMLALVAGIAQAAGQRFVQRRAVCGESEGGEEHSYSVSHLRRVSGSVRISDRICRRS